MAPTSSSFRPAFVRLASASPVWAAAVMIGAIALLAWSAQAAIPLKPVPITLQSFAVITLAALLGWQLGGLAVLAYLAMGASGYGVFSGGRGGMEVIAGPGGGFLIGFVAAALVVGALQEYWARLRPLPLLITLVLGHLVLMAAGAIWLAHLRGLSFAIEKGTLPFLPGAALKSLAALATVLLIERLAGSRSAR